MRWLTLTAVLVAVVGVLVMFGSRSGLFQHLFFIVSQWSEPEEAADDRELFQSFDLDADGCLSPEEFHQVSKRIAKQHVRLTQV